MELLGLLLRLGGSLFLVAVLLVLRVWQVVIPQRVKASVSSYSKPLFHHQNATKSQKTRRQIRVMAVLGSGGHTTALLKLMKKLKRDVYTPITFVVAETDKTSQTKTKLDWKPTERDSFGEIP
ncbi:UDP-N-acetylglucosamine transferase subunit ALG14, partial [Phytophthora palmivora]